MKGSNGEFWAMPKNIMAMIELSLEARVVYSILWTRRNGENEAWPSQKYIAEHLGIGERSVKRYIAELVKYSLIEAKRSGVRKTNTYILTGQFGPTLGPAVSLSKGSDLSPSSLREQIKKTDNNSAAFTAEGYIDQMLDNPRMHIQVIAVYADEMIAARRMVPWETKDEASAFVKRYTRAATTLAPYGLAKVRKTIQFLLGKNINGRPMDFGLETVGRWITKSEVYG